MSNFTPSRDGGPAFPRSAAEHSQGGHYEQDGMSLRDWFAAQAMNGIISVAPFKDGVTYRQVAGTCYEWADAMLAARAEGRSTPSDSEGV
jgi:hypothetical protein